MRGGESRPKVGGPVSCGRDLPQVKPAAKVATNPGGRSRWRRHLEGWQLGVVTVGIAGLAALLTVPRPVAPDVLPVPQPDRLEQQRAAAVERARAQLVVRDGLAFDVRAVGEYFRRYSRAAAEHRSDAASVLLPELRRLTQLARQRHGPEPLLRLRSLQTQYFVRALANWEVTGRETVELQELGGTLLREASRAGWVRPPHRLHLNGAERTAMFRIRWADLTGLAQHKPFSPSLNDWKTYYRFLLEHPDQSPETAAAMGADAGALAQSRLQLRVVQALAKRDPSYPALLATGVLQYRLGAYLAAAHSFQTHLDLHPDGAWRLRAQNYLAAAVARAHETRPLAE